MSGLSSTLSFATDNLPLFSLAMSSRTGAIILHGPHHSAQKSITTGMSEPRTDSSKVESESVMMASDTAGCSFREAGRGDPPGFEPPRGRKHYTPPPPQPRSGG